MCMPEFKDMLNYLRTREGLTQTELSAATGIGRGAISMYEAGKRRPDYETLEVFADYFNVNMDTLLGRVEENRAPAQGEVSDAKRTLLDMVDRMSDEDVDKMLRLIAVMFPET